MVGGSAWYGKAAGPRGWDISKANESRKKPKAAVSDLHPGPLVGELCFLQGSFHFCGPQLTHLHNEVRSSLKAILALVFSNS